MSSYLQIEGITITLKHKHILIFFTDQQRWDTIGALGNSYIQTPNLDALVRESVTFNRCITPSPVCVPARLSMFAGQYPARTGCNNNNADTVYTGRGFYSLLTENGYQSCCVGKMHHLIDPYGDMGFEKRWIQEELSDPRDHYTQFIRENYPWIIDYHGMRSEMYYVPQISQLPAKDHPTAWVGDRCVEFINSCDPQRPMLLVSSFIHPHPPYCPPSPWQKLYRDDPPLPFEVEQDELDKFWDMIGDRCSCERLMMSRQDILRAKNFYYACISFIDYQVGRIIQALKDKGMYDDTLILFTSDHGDMMGDYGAIGKRSMVDSSCRIPFILRYPGMGHQERYDACSLVDVAPTILSYAGIPYDEKEFDGVDLFGENNRRYVYSQYGCGENGTYMITDGVQKLVYVRNNDRYHFFDTIPEKKDIYDPANPKAAEMKELLEAYRLSDRNNSQNSQTYEKYTKTHPHYPGRMDHTLRRDEEAAMIPAGYRIDLE
jgi:arylsulfatase